jgi:hypothetical protein
LEKERWLDARRREVLPVRYFHATYTLPDQLRALSLRNQQVSYGILFKSASESLQELARDPKHLGAQVGFFSILHTWTQTIFYHPHLHCIIPGGGVSLDGKKWIDSKEDFFIHYKVLSRKFRGKFLHYLKEAYYNKQLKFPGRIGYLESRSRFERLLTDLYAIDWVVDCRPAANKAGSIIDYLGRYVYRVAISNDRILKVQDDEVRFRYRDSNGDKFKTMSLPAFEFIRRFLCHILPERFVKIRYYGFLSNCSKKTKLVWCQKLLGAESLKEESSSTKESWEELLERVTGINPLLCPKCGLGKMEFKELLPKKHKRAPP